VEWIVEDRGEVEVWTIAGEARRNTFSRAMLSQLLAEVERAGGRRNLRCVVLTGQGQKAFCAGADLKERATMSAEQVHRFLRDISGAMRAIEASPRVFVAAVNGAALGGGCELALACDLRIASSTAELGLPEVSLGIIPGAGGTQRLPRAIGMARAKDLILTGRRIGAEEAAAIGLVNRVVAPERLLPEALAYAEMVARNAPVSLRQAKRAMDEGFGMPIEQGIAFENQMYQPCLGTRDRDEALRAFAEKRRPVFTGE
jgi:enoyl-CoA hydratase/carnithine racemase